jgi:hypothetical protein
MFVICNSNSLNQGGSMTIASEDGKVRSLPVLFLYLVPGFEGGWPAT